MVRCRACYKGLNSTYIRVGAKESFKKIGLYCITCDIHYSPDLLKQYTGMQKQYTAPNNNQTIKRTYADNNIANIPINPHILENSIRLNRNKLYNCQQDIHQKRVRSVVRISRRSSEPQVMGSKPTGPVNHMGSNNSWLYNIMNKRRYIITR